MFLFHMCLVIAAAVRGIWSCWGWVYFVLVFNEINFQEPTFLKMDLFV